MISLACLTWIARRLPISQRIAMLIALLAGGGVTGVLLRTAEAEGLASEGVVRLRPRVTATTPSNGIVQAGYSQTEPDTPTTHVAELRSDAGEQPTITLTGAVCYGACPRIVPAPGCQLGLIPGGPGIVPFDPTQYPDEYLCDGGDRGFKYWHDGQRTEGLETEDTIGQCIDDQGRPQVVPSSRVCIYAPRFAAVRTVTSSLLNEHIDQLGNAYESVRSAGYNTHFDVVEETQRDALQNVRVKSRASGVDMNALEGALTKVDEAVLNHHSAAAYQNLTFIKDGLYRRSEGSALGQAIQTAGVWTRDQNPVIAAHDNRGHELEARFSPQQYIGAEDQRTPGELRIVKLADKEVAQPGDVITFTLRFDNLGERELLDIRVVDNLTPRLEYVAGSVESELAGGLDTESNGEGSSILKFHLNNPLAGKTGGAITFQCRVK